MLIQGTKTVGICGIGQMGSACAVAFCRAGYDVIPWARNADILELIDPSLETLDRWCDENLDRSSRIRREIWE
jgi:3-hydroxyacyl-CoA dehydrogenase